MFTQSLIEKKAKLFKIHIFKPAYLALLGLSLWSLSAVREGTLCCLYTCTQWPALSFCTWVCWQGRGETTLICVTSQRLKLTEIQNSIDKSEEIKVSNLPVQLHWTHDLWTPEYASMQWTLFLGIVPCSKCNGKETYCHIPISFNGNLPVIFF